MDLVKYVGVRIVGFIALLLLGLLGSELLRADHLNIAPEYSNILIVLSENVSEFSVAVMVFIGIYSYGFFNQDEEE